MTMPEDVKCTLENEFSQFEAEFHKDRSSSATCDHLICVLSHLLKDYKYSKRDLAFALNVEQLTVTRWQKGTSMKPDTFEAFCTFVEAVLDGLPQRPIGISNTGFVTWRRLFEERQRHFARIWYLSEEAFLLTSSLTVKEGVVQLFAAADQDEKQRPSPTLIYLCPKGSKSEASLREWVAELETVKEERALRGTILGFCIEDCAALPWFLPGLRAMILERDGKLESYLRILMPKQNKADLLEALGAVDDEDDQTPWLSVHRQTADQWYAVLKGRFLKQVEAIVQDQQDRGEAFHMEIREVAPKGEPC